MKVLVVDVGGSNVKILATGQTEVRRAQSGPTMTAQAMTEAVKRLAEPHHRERQECGGDRRRRHGN